MFWRYLPALVVAVVFDSADHTIGLVQRVLALDDITVTDFMLGLNVVGMSVLHFISKLIFRVRLK